MISAVQIDQAEARAAMQTVAGRVGDLLRSSPDTATRLPGSDWTVAEAAAHLVVVFRMYRHAVDGEASPLAEHYRSGSDQTRARLAAGNAGALQEVAQRDGAGLAAQLGEAVEGFVRTCARHSANEPVAIPWFPPGETRPLGVLSGVVLAELLVHGYDMAKALHRPWPLDPAHARLAVVGAASVAPMFVDGEAARGVRATYRIHVRRAASYVVRVADGGARVETRAHRVDCHLSVDPVAFLLVAYGRVGQWGPIAKGKLVAWGRRPWLGFTFKSLFLNP